MNDIASYTKRTQMAYIWTRILDTPFWGLFNLLPFILYKDLHASPLELAAIISLKPLTSIFSSYWSARVHQNPHRLVPSILAARWCAYIPFLIFPFIHNLYYAIFCYGLFMFLQTGMMPAWMELLKQNIPASKRDRVFSYMQAFGYLGGGLLPFVLGWALDHWLEAWRWMFPLAAMVALSSHAWQRKILINTMPSAESQPSSHPLLHPWKSAWSLLKKRPDFMRFQIGFMLIGCGLMVIQPALPIFFVDRLHLSYTELGIAITLCKGIGFASSSPFWSRWLQRVDIFYFGAVIASFAALFPLLLALAQEQMLWLYVAYFIYGFMQSGNELSWNLSGPIFAKQEDSSPFSSINIIAVGVRGIFIPALGAFLLGQFGSPIVMALSGILCLLAALRMALYSRTTEMVKSAL